MLSTVLLLTCWVLWRSPSWREARPERVDANPTAAAALSPRIVDLAITHLPKLNKAKYDRPRMGRLGERSFTTRLGDDLTVRAELSERAYAYLISFRPDGQIELCTPEDEAVVPGPTRHLQYPPPAKADEVLPPERRSWLAGVCGGRLA